MSLAFLVDISTVGPASRIFKTDVGHFVSLFGG